MSSIGAIERYPVDIQTVSNSSRLGEPSMSLTTFANAMSTSCWARTVETWSHNIYLGQSTGSGAGGPAPSNTNTNSTSSGAGISKVPRPTSLFGFSPVPRAGFAVPDEIFPTLTERSSTSVFSAYENLSTNIDGSLTDPDDGANATMPNRGSCFQVLNSSFPSHAWLITPHCPVALLSGDTKSLNVRVPLQVPTGTSADALGNEGKLSSGNGILADFALPESEAYLVAKSEYEAAYGYTKNSKLRALEDAAKRLDIAKKSLYCHPSCPDVLEASRNLLSMSMISRQLRKVATQRLAGNEYEIGPWILRTGTVFSRSSISLPQIVVVELDLVAVVDLSTPHSVFLDAFMQLVPQASHMVQVNAITGEQVWNVRPEREMAAKQAFAASQMTPIGGSSGDAGSGSGLQEVGVSDVEIDKLVLKGTPLRAVVVSTHRFPGFEQYMLPRIFDPRHAALITAYATQITPTEK